MDIQLLLAKNIPGGGAAGGQRPPPPLIQGTNP
jgi:hypothetical protein